MVKLFVIIHYYAINYSLEFYFIRNIYYFIIKIGLIIMFMIVYLHNFFQFFYFIHFKSFFDFIIIVIIIKNLYFQSEYLISLEFNLREPSLAILSDFK